MTSPTPTALLRDAAMYGDVVASLGGRVAAWVMVAARPTASAGRLRAPERRLPRPPDR